MKFKDAKDLNIMDTHYTYTHLHWNSWRTQNKIKESADGRIIQTLQNTTITFFIRTIAYNWVWTHVHTSFKILQANPKQNNITNPRLIDELSTNKWG